MGVTAGISSVSVEKSGQKFYKAQFAIAYSGGAVILSANANGSGNTLVDDIMTINVTGSPALTFDYSPGCHLTPLAPTDISNRFQLGLNKVTVTFKDKKECGGFVLATPVWITAAD